MSEATLSIWSWLTHSEETAAGSAGCPGKAPGRCSSRLGWLWVLISPPPSPTPCQRSLGQNSLLNPTFTLSVTTISAQELLKRQPRLLQIFIWKVQGDHRFSGEDTHEYPWQAQKDSLPGREHLRTPVAYVCARRPAPTLLAVSTEAPSSVVEILSASFQNAQRTGHLLSSIPSIIFSCDYVNYTWKQN